MKIAVLGTGAVGTTIASKLADLNHQVMMGSRTQNNEMAQGWVSKTGGQAASGDYAQAAAFGEIVFNCTKGEGSLQALTQAGSHNLKGKIIVDVANPLDFSKGMPASLFLSNTNSLGEEIQKTFPESQVVKTLNTMWCGLMVNPRMLSELHTLFICGNSTDDKEKVKTLLYQFGWQDDEILDLGDITSARGTEGYLPLWLRIYMATNTGTFNIRIVR